MLLVPGLDSTKEEFRSTEELFLERGLATFIDGPGQGEAEYDLPIRGDWEVPGRVLLDWLSAQPDIGRTGSRCGASASAVTTRRGSPAATPGSGPASRCAARTTSATAGTDCPSSPARRSGCAAGASDDDAAPPAALELGLDGRTGDIACPLLVVIGKLDRLIPWRDGARLAEEVPGARTARLETGNHGCANVAPLHRYLTADWVAERPGLIERPTSGARSHRTTSITERTHLMAYRSA